MHKADLKPVEGSDPIVNLEIALKHGLLEEEYNKIVKLLGRVPNYTELGIFSVMWSEHCSYKNSILQLKTLPRKGKYLLVEAGEENAGLIDIGNGLAVAFKIESHNHPSAVEPYQGAATGVGGILRDIFSMGARPIAVLDSLRFGELSDERVRHLFKRVVKGISDYGNSFGVPTVAGEVYFEKSYGINPLVNVMAVGIVEHEKIARAVAKGKGNSVLIVGSKTGRDGIHGATFASEELTEESQAKRSSVQVGDPFTGKKLLEATLEAISTGYVVGVQDMGAAGISCCTTEMSARGKSGMTIELDKIPLREKAMTPYEIMLSESQERMLLVVKQGYEMDVINIFKKWDIDAEIIGKVEDENIVKIMLNEKCVAQVPPEALVLGGTYTPVYKRETKFPDYIKKCRSFDANKIKYPTDLEKCFLNIIKRPNIASKRWVYEQYDTMVRTNTIQVEDTDAAVLRIKGTNKALAVKTDCNAKYVYLNPKRGTSIAVAEAARNVVCTGAKPIAITNCLNFGNPYDPEIYWQFTEAISGMREACLALNTPVTGGNVSFYNENPEGAILPTPVIGMLGLIEDVRNIQNIKFKEPKDVIIELGINKGEIGGSEYQEMILGEVSGDAPELDLEYEKRLQDLCYRLANEHIIKSMHDVSDGGIAVTLLECLANTEKLGCRIFEGYSQNLRPDFCLFGETQSRIIITADIDKKDIIIKHAKNHNVDISIIGEVTSEETIRFDGIMSIDLNEAKETYRSAIPNVMRVEVD